MKAKLFAAAICAALVGACAPAMAQEQARNVYLGASAGPVRIKGVCGGSGVVSCQNDDTAVKLFFGYVLSRNFALELALNDLGGARVQRSTQMVTPFGPQTIASTDTYEVRGLDATMIGSWPLTSQFALYGKFGFYLATVDTNETGFYPSESSSYGNGDFTYGAGGRVDITDRFALRIEWQRYHALSIGSTGSDVDVISAGALFRF